MLQLSIPGLHPELTMSFARARSRTASSGVERNNQEPTALPKILSINFEAIQVGYAHVLHPLPIKYDTTKWLF